MTEKNPVGRPSIYSEELAAKICSQIAEGLSLKTICRADDMPDKSNVFRWLATKEDFRDIYEKATATRSDVFVEEMLEISDDEKIEVQRSRLMVDTRKWIASKLKPKKYGDNTTIEHKGTLTVFTADISPTFGFLSGFAVQGSNSALPEPVQDRPVLSAPLRP